MAPLARVGLCRKGCGVVSKDSRQASTEIAMSEAVAPERVRLKRVSSCHAKPYPPQGQERQWWQQLKPEAVRHSIISRSPNPGAPPKSGSGSRAEEVELSKSRRL
jgi:hypothetical protein